MSDARTTVRARSPIPPDCGIGLRAPHADELIATRPDIGWIEVHSENYFSEGGTPLRMLEDARAHYPLSLHGIGASLGSVDPLNTLHLSKLKRLIQRVEPGLVSEHLCWSSVDGRYLNDLLPMPYTDEALAHIAYRIEQVQEFLGRQILIENLSSYLQYRHSVIPEWEFMAEVARRAGCGILLDVNNVYVSSRNLGFSAETYLAAVPRKAVQEIHLAGHTVKTFPEGEVLIDTHSTVVSDPVWSLYRQALKRFGQVPTLIEWDTELPALSVLVGEAHAARRCMATFNALVA